MNKRMVALILAISVHITIMQLNSLFFIKFAHTIRQLFDKGKSFIRVRKIKIKEISSTLPLELISTCSTLSLQTNFQLRFDGLII